MFAIELGVVAVGLGCVAYFSWRAKPGGYSGPYGRGSVAGGLTIVAVGVVLIVAGVVSLIFG